MGSRSKVHNTDGKEAKDDNGYFEAKRKQRTINIRRKYKAKGSKVLKVSIKPLT